MKLDPTPHHMCGALRENYLESEGFPRKWLGLVSCMIAHLCCLVGLDVAEKAVVADQDVALASSLCLGRDVELTSPSNAGLAPRHDGRAHWAHSPIE